VGASVGAKTRRSEDHGFLSRIFARGVAAILLIASPLVAQKKVERRLPLGMEGALRVVNMVGSVVVHGWDKDTVLVRGTLGAGNSFFMGGGYTGVKMFVESVNDRDPKPTRLEIWVPARVRLWVKTATANIDVSDVSGGLDLYVVSGTIDVRGNPRELNAEAIDGDIHITGSPSWLRAKSATGAITFQGASSDAGLSTVSGPIKVDGGSGVFERTKIETVTGNISFAGRLDRSGAFDFDSHSGSIDVVIREKTSATFSVVTIAGSITNSLSKKAPIPGRFGRGAELTTDDGGGGAKVSVRTFKGPVTLRRMK
jgi:putative adhesin